MEELICGKYRMRIPAAQFSLSTDTMALADFARVKHSARVCDLGCGSGALGLLLLARDETLSITGVEIQKDAARCAMENAAQNNLSGLSVLHGDLRAYRTLLPANGFDTVIEYFNQMTEALSGIEALQTDIIANVSHEMKTPLAVMQNYGTLLQAPDLPEEKRLEYAKGVTDGVKRLADMMTNILKLNRLENQQIFPQVEHFDLGEQLCESILQYESVWEKGGIEIDTDIAEDVAVQGDRELLALVWNNLLSNAFKFTPSGGTVSVSLTADKAFATVRVQDTGCGMRAEVGTHIFEKFYQGDTSHATQGNGLGLALVKRVVDILKGEISVESTVGVGSTFTVKIRRT